MVLKKKMKEACECREVLKEIKLNHVVLIKLRSMIKTKTLAGVQGESRLTAYGMLNQNIRMLFV